MQQSVFVHSYGGPEVLSIESFPIIQPKSGQLLINVYYTAVLPLDWKIRSGAMKEIFPVEFPYVPGSVVSGVIDQIGEDVTGFYIGQRVFGKVMGAYAESAIGDITEIIPIPEDLGYMEAALIMGGGSTAWEALFNVGHLKKNQKILVIGAAGGVGQFAVQLAKRQGAQVLAIASTSNLAFVKSLGADQVYDYTNSKPNEIDNQVDLVLDVIGGEVQSEAWSVLKKGGTLVSLVQPPSEEQAALSGATGAFVTGDPDHKDLSLLANMMADGDIKTEAPHIFNLHSVRQAHEFSQQGHGRGRVLLKVQPKI